MAPRTWLSISLLLVMVAFVPYTTHAQLVAPFSISINPIYPTPFGSAKVSLLSTTLDLSAGTVTGFVNGAQVYQGSAVPFTVKIGAPGAPTIIKVVLVVNGQSYSESISIVPGSLSLVLEPQSTAPPLYAGKPSIPISGTVRAVAIADFRTSSGTRIDPTTLAYSWSIDNTSFQNASGIGKSSAILAVPLLYRENTVTVLVKTKDGSQVASASASIAGTQPSIRVYRTDPLLGILFDHALSGSYDIPGSEATFFAAPFSFSLVGGGPALAWEVGGSAAQTGSSITLRPQGTGAGTAPLFLSVNNPTTSENATFDLSLSYGGSAGAGLFGL